MKRAWHLGSARVLVTGALIAVFGNALAVPAPAQTPAPAPTPSTSPSPEPSPTPVPSPTGTEVVTLSAARDRIDFGERVAVRGSIEPGVGQTVVIEDQDGAELARATTDGQGRFAAKVEPKRNVSLRARWGGISSDPVKVRVRPLVGIKLGATYLFDRALVSGTVRPGHGRVQVRLLRNGSVVRRASIAAGDGTFRARMRIGRPGTYRAVVVVDDEDHLRARARTRRRSPSLPSLAIGERGKRVALLEQRLVDLGYHLDRVDRSYGAATGDAVIAFNKVQGRARLSTVDASTWHALASPARPRARDRSPGYHIEVDQTKQVLYAVRDGQVRHILHVSTGAGAATRDGVFHFHRKLEGYSAGGLYYPSYFDGLRAIHGWPEVPTYNASHGCVRVPMWAAQWIFSKIDIGMEIRIYHWAASPPWP